jgi:hypothetical protein
MLLLRWSLISVLCLMPTLLAAADSPYFPESGPAAVHQTTLELGTPAVVLWVALQPGYEDLARIAHLRMATGARVVVAHVTNGESTPDDEGGSLPAFTAARRKEEADRVARLLGSTAYFLNIPDPGAVPNRGILERIWNPDTVNARLDRALRRFRPDVVVLSGDRRGPDSLSERSSLLKELVLRTVQGPTGVRAVVDTSKIPRWEGVRRVFVEIPASGPDKAYDAVHPSWHISYRAIAGEAGALYRSLSLQRPHWTAGGDPGYRVIYPSGQRKASSMVGGVPSTGKHTRPFRPVIDGLIRQKRGALFSPRLVDVVRAIDGMDSVYARYRQVLTPVDNRIVAGWKNSLEMLRCALLGVHVPVSVDDSVITQGQIVYLRFGTVLPSADSTRTQIFFPGAVNRTWGINESPLSQFPFSSDREFRVLSTHHLEYSLPMTQFGISQSNLWSRFSYIVVHRDPVRTHDYIYRGEIQFRGAPRRTMELLTPLVRAVEGTPLVVRLSNTSRDAYKGILRLDDSLVVPVEHPVLLASRGETLLDTLPFRLRAPLPAGDHLMKVKLSGGGELSFVARSFDVRVDSAAAVGLISGLHDGPVQQALMRLRVDWTRIGPAPNGDLSRFNVIVLDRDVTESAAGLNPEQWNAILAWVREGGTLVVMPPVTMQGEIPGVSLRATPFLSPTASVLVDSAAGILVRPNRLTPSDWDGWIVARAFGSVGAGSGRTSATAVASDTGPLVVSLAEGKGTIRVIALDLYSQLMNVHPGAHRLLANLLHP